MSTRVFVVIVNYMAWRDTIECVESILKSTYRSFHILIVENGSPNESFEAIVSWAKGDAAYQAEPHGEMERYSNPPLEKPVQINVLGEDEGEDFHTGDGMITLIKSCRNLGFSYGNNIGLKRIAKVKRENDLVWILNNDTVVHPDSMEALVRFSNKKKGVPFAAGTMVRCYDKPQEVDSAGWGYLKVLSAKTSHKNRGLMTFKYLVCSSLFTNILQYMDDGYFLYFEDNDYSKLLLKAGVSLEYCAESVVYHKINASTSTVGTIKEIKLRSMVRYYRKHYPLITFWIAGIRIIFYMIFLKKRNFSVLIKALMEKNQ